MRRIVLAAIAASLLASAPAAAEVRFGSNVFIGGYDFSHRRYRSVVIRRVAKLDGPPGCRRVPRASPGGGPGARGLVERCYLPARR